MSIRPRYVSAFMVGFIGPYLLDNYDPLILLLLLYLVIVMYKDDYNPNKWGKRDAGLS